ncbi:MAG: DALR domain-containing protein, partial [Acidobacteriota bacterium]
LKGQTFSENRRTTLSPEKLDKTKSFQEKFSQALSDDLNTPQALAVVWEVVKSNIPSEDKYDLIMSFDEILGLRLATSHQPIATSEIPKEIQKLANQREQLRKDRKFDEADEVRKQIEGKGFAVEDTSAGAQIKKMGLIRI